MKKYKLVIFVCAALLVTSEGFAQKRKAKGRAGSGYGASSGYGSGTSGYGSSGTSGYGTGNTGAKGATSSGKPTSGYGAGTSGYGTGTGTSGYGSGSSGYGGGNAAAAQQKSYNQNLPITVIKSSGTGIGDSVAPSLRNDAIIERNLVKDRIPIVYEHIREDDAVYRQRVWREIDTREKMNLPFRYAAKEDAGDQHFISILYNAIQAGEVTVFSGDDDRFTTPLTKEEVAKVITGGMDTVEKYDMNGDVIGYEVRSRMVEPDSIYRFRLKEEWVFDKESSRMFVRILGIAPIMDKYSADGSRVVAPNLVLFWAYYPDLRPTLAKYEVYNGKNFAGRMSWEELFESRFFSSYIVKSSIDNPFDQSLRQYIKDPLFRLLEGENIKERIFNYEQDLWSY